MEPLTKIDTKGSTARAAKVLTEHNLYHWCTCRCGWQHNDLSPVLPAHVQHVIKALTDAGLIRQDDP